MTSSEGQPPRGEHESARPWEAKARLLFLTVVLPLLSLTYLWQATRIELPSRELVVSPRAFPILVGVLATFVSLVIGVREMRAAREQRGQLADATLPQAEEISSSPGMPVIEEEEPNDDTVTSWRDVLVVLAAFSVYIAVFRPVGFFLSTLGFLMGLSTYFEPRRWLRNAIVCLLFTLATGYVFDGLLDVGLPFGVVPVSF